MYALMLLWMLLSACQLRADRLWSVEDLADYLGVPVKTIYTWRHQGVGPVGIRVGKYVRYRRESVEAWLAARADPRPAA